MQKSTIKQRFKSAIRRGTGEAYLIARENPKIDFSKYILNAAANDLSYHPQVEPSHANYIAELVYVSNKKDELVKDILKLLTEGESEGYGLDQLFNISSIFAKEGNIEARKAIYQRFDKEITHDSVEFLRGEGEILEIDGLDGLKYIAETKGRIIANNSEVWEDSWTVDSFQEENPLFNVYKELEKAAEGNKYIQIYLDAIKKHKFKRGKNKKSKHDYNFVKEKIDSLKIFGPYIAENLTNKELKKLADDFLKETNRLKQEKYLRVFSIVKFPSDNYQPILKIAKGTNSRKDRLVEYAVKALKHFSGDDIREFAIEKLSKTNKHDDYLMLLVSNYREGDSKLLKSIAEKYKNEKMIHSLVWSYVEIYRANQTKECQEPLEAIYDKLNCGLHRRDIVEIMIDSNALPSKIRQEIRYDSSKKIRKLSKKIEK